MGALTDIGILGTGVWDAEPVGNERFERFATAAGAVRDPFKGRRGEDGSISIAGLELTKARYPRTLSAVERAFADPYRGARRRRILPEDMRVSDAEVSAARAAIAGAGLTAADIDLVLTHSFLPDEFTPKNAARVAYALGIGGAGAWELDSVCNSALSQLTAGAALISSGIARHVLCVQSCVYSRVTDPNTASTVQEADLAAAYVLGRRPGGQLAFSWRTDGRLHDATLLQWDAPTGAPKRKYWERAKEQLLIRFDPELQPQVMGDLQRYAPVVVEEALGRAGMTIDDVDVFISHQPMAWYPEFIEETLGLRAGAMFHTFEEYANVNSPSLTASLHHALLAGRVAPGTRVLFFGPAAGYTYGAVALRW
ncbi:MAG: 3-oxoacyl-[acyl-carrier-protein] synthase III C-terminal domain-containing protein [Polyangiaceae bacterium]